MRNFFFCATVNTSLEGLRRPGDLGGLYICSVTL
nr:MAG TPA: hypothetical protein [Caudoviricetes sp.]